MRLELKKFKWLGIRLEAEEKRSEFTSHFFQIPLKILGGFQGKARGASAVGRESLGCSRPALPSQPHPHPLRKAPEAALGKALPRHKARDPERAKH